MHHDDAANAEIEVGSNMDISSRKTGLSVVDNPSLQTLSRICLTLLRESQLKPPYMSLFAFAGLLQPLFSTRAADTSLSILSDIKYRLSIVASSPLRLQFFHLLDFHRAKPSPWFERKPTETGTPSHRGSRYQRRRGREDGRQSRGPLANTTTTLCRK